MVEVRVTHVYVHVHTQHTHIHTRAPDITTLLVWIKLLNLLQEIQSELMLSCGAEVSYQVYIILF